MGAPFWVTSATAGFEGDVFAKNPHETLFIGGLQVPGLVTVKAEPSIQFDRQKVNGRDGATIITRGYLPGPVEIEVLLWRKEQWSLFQDVIARIWRKPGKLAASKAAKTGKLKDATLTEQAALDIRHPNLQLLGIQRVVVVGVSLPEPGPIPQSRIMRIRCMEYVPSPKKAVTAKATGAALAPINPAYDPNVLAANGPKTKPGAADSGPNGPPTPPASGPF